MRERESRGRKGGNKGANEGWRKGREVRGNQEGLGGEEGGAITFELSLPVLYRGERHSNQEGASDLLYLKEVVQEGNDLHSLAEA
jgi:hypothetical protein